MGHSPTMVSTKPSALSNHAQSAPLAPPASHQPLTNAAANASQTHASTTARSTLLAKHGHQHKTPATPACANSTHSLERSTQNAQSLTVQHSMSHVQFTELRCPPTGAARPASQSLSLSMKAAPSRSTTTT